MIRSKFSEPQIIGILKEVDQGRSISEVARELRIDKSTIYYWSARNMEAWKCLG